MPAPAEAPAPTTSRIETVLEAAAGDELVADWLLALLDGDEAGSSTHDR